MRRFSILLVMGLLPGLALAQNWTAATSQNPHFKRTEKRQPCANFQPLRQPFFGELHLHTEYSADAVTLETRNTPADAYRFARGEAVGLPPFVDTRDARQKQLEAGLPGESPEVSPHPYCLPPQHCEHTATREVQFPEGRQLDFAAITDHSEFFGETNICWYEGNKQCTSDTNCADGQFCFGAVSGSTGKCVPNGYSAKPCILGRDEVANLKASSLLGADVFGSYIAAETPQRFPFCKEPGAGGDDTCIFQAKNIWQQIQTDAAAAYDRTSRCSFTSFIAYEYTGTPAMGECVKDANPCFANADCVGHGGICCTSSDTAPGCKELILGGSNNLHRNVIFRNDDVIGLPISYIEEPTGCGKGSKCQQNQGGALASPQQMLEKLKQECLNDPSHPRCDVLTIPHNSDISGGAMFLLPETFDEASIRREMEPLVELFQIKGGSECRFSEAALWGTTDEMCNFENLDYSKLGGSLIKQPTPKTILPNSYVRNVLKEGLAYQQEHGINPFKLGFVGATDDHNGTPSATEAAMYAKASAHGDVSFVVSGEALNEANFLGLETNGGGITGVWAEENSRDSIFEALKRRETFATSGTRPVVRFFGGFGLPATMCQKGNFALQGYTNGVPMGGTLSGVTTSPPRFAVAAMYDAGSMSGAKLQSAQIIKGWVDKDGKTHESVVNVAGNPHNGASVDLRTCKPIGPGLKDLCSVWTDPDFDPNQPAFYYARVLENPSCRWNQYYCNARGVNCNAPQSQRQLYKMGISAVLQQCGTSGRPAARLEFPDLVHTVNPAWAHAPLWRWMRSPALHFVLIGALLFAVDRVRQNAAPAASPARPVIVINAEQVSRMRSDFELKWRIAPTPAQLDGLIQQAADNEMLYQEARHLGLGVGDPSVRLRLIQKMRAISVGAMPDSESLYRQALELGLDDDVVVRGILVHKMVLLLQEDLRPVPVSDRQVMAYVQDHRARFLQPATVTFSQVFLSASARTTGLDQQARRLLVRLQSKSLPPQAASAFSDPFPLAAELPAQSRAMLSRFFGREFASAVFASPLHTWTGPVASPFGLHLVWVSARTEEQLLPIDAIRQSVTYEILQERQQVSYARAMERLHARYTVRIDRADSGVARRVSAKDQS